MKMRGNLPNFEARAISFILFVLKLLFALDDVTEYHFSNFANSVNATMNANMFNFKQWLIFIQYRKLVIQQYHYPTAHLYNNSFDQHQLFINFLKEHVSKYDLNIQNEITFKVLKDLLGKLRDMQTDSTIFPEFPVSLTPFDTYLSIILNKIKHGYLNVIAMQEFKKTSVDFLLEPHLYLSSVNEDVEIKHSGANENLELVKVIIPESNRRRRKDLLQKKIPVIISNASVAAAHISDLIKEPQKINTDKTLEYYSIENAHIFKRNKNKLKKMLKLVNTEKRNAVDAASSHSRTEHADHEPYLQHYNPHERFLLKSQDVSALGWKDFQIFFKKLPYTFQLVMDEGARITEQTSQDLFEEYNLLEIYLCYKFFNKTKHLNKEITNLVNKSIKFW